MTREMGPRSRRIHEALREQIMNGELPPGSRLPSHTELAASYGVAPMTVRQVLSHLEEEGLVSREQGRGTFVRQPRQQAVLIVEDDAQIAELMATIVRGTGVHPFVANEVADAQVLLATEPGIAFVFSDVRLPEAEDGIEFIRAVRRRYPDLPVAAVTGFPGDLAALHGTPESPILVLPKPFRPAQVREALQMALRL
jgi:DNA-binding transcriptional regulator YhcF (GntR family)